MTSRTRSSSNPANPRRVPPPLDGPGLEALALRYVERYATTRGKLVLYLRRKLGERGWGGEGAPDPAALADRLATLGYIDDRGFAEMKGGALGRRGFGPRRVSAALREAGIATEDRAAAEQAAAEGALASALALARRRRIGPFAAVAPDRPARERAIAMLVRAGHGLDLARRIATAPPGAVLDPEEEA